MNSKAQVLNLFAEQVISLGYKFEMIRFSDENTKAIEGYQFKYIRNKASNITDYEMYNEFYVYLLITRTTFVALDNDFEKSFAKKQFAAITKNEEESRVLHIHYTNNNYNEVLPYKWIHTLEDGFWSYDLTEKEFLLLNNKNIMPTESYLRFGLSE